MKIEIHKPELEQHVMERIQSGQYQDAEELLSKALDALREKEGSALAEPTTGAALLAILQASPYPEIDLMPRHVRLPVRDVVL